jgi:hypothetical protein
MKNMLTIAASAVLALAIGSAHAGYKYTGGVAVNDSLGFAYGTAMGARAAPDTSSYIGCYVTAFSSGSPVAYCFAMNSAGAWGGCSSFSPGIVQVAATAGPNSYYSVSWDHNSTCTYVVVDNSSYNGPLQP